MYKPEEANYIYSIDILSDSLKIFFTNIENNPDSIISRNQVTGKITTCGLNMLKRLLLE